MAKTQPAATTPVVTKMALARKLYAEVMAKAAPEGKTHRGIFMERAETIGLSSKAANTYFQNIKGEHDSGAVQAAPANPAESLRNQVKTLQTAASDLNKQINALAKQVA